MAEAAAELALALTSRRDEIDRCRQALGDFCPHSGLDGRVETLLSLVLEELIANTVAHGRANAAAPIDIRIVCERDAVTIEYADRGRPFDPRTDLPDDARTLPVEERPVGRLGWALIGHYCRIVDYRREGDANRVTLSLPLPPAGAEE